MTTPQPPVPQRTRTSFRGVVVMFLGLIPLGALASFYTLYLTPATVSAPDELRRVSFGWPFPWLSQDLSRYDPVEFPTTLEYTGQRAWHDPIETDYDWLMFAADALIFGVVLTALILLVATTTRASRRRAGR